MGCPFWKKNITVFIVSLVGGLGSTRDKYTLRHQFQRLWGGLFYIQYIPQVIHAVVCLHLFWSYKICCMAVYIIYLYPSGYFFFSKIWDGNTFAFCISFPDKEMGQTVENLPHGRSLYHTKLIPWLFMSRGSKKPGKEQTWYLIILPGIYRV